MLHHEQPRLDHLHHKAQRRDRARSAPDAQLISIGPDAEMDAGPFDSGGEFGEGRGIEREWPLHQKGGPAGFPGQIGERDGRRASFFPSQAGPERGIDDPLDGGRVGRDRVGGASLRLGYVTVIVLSYRVGDGVGGRVG
jgi:hypothetical protein